MAPNKFAHFFIPGTTRVSLNLAGSDDGLESVSGLHCCVPSPWRYHRPRQDPGILSVSFPITP